MGSNNVFQWKCMKYNQLAHTFSDFSRLLLSSRGPKNFCIPTITAGNKSFDAYVKYQNLMYGVILSCELTEGREEYILLCCMGQLKIGNSHRIRKCRFVKSFTCQMLVSGHGLKILDTVQHWVFSANAQDHADSRWLFIWQNCFSIKNSKCSEYFDRMEQDFGGSLHLCIVCYSISFVSLAKFMFFSH